MTRWSSGAAVLVAVFAGCTGTMGELRDADAERVDGDVDVVAADADADDGEPDGDEPDADEPPAEVPGLRAEYFSAYHDLVLERVERAIDHDWGEGAPAPEVPENFFSARWIASIRVPAAGEYTLWAETDDGVRVWVGDQLVIDAWVPRYPARDEAVVTLAEGLVPLRVEYFEVDITAVARLGWRSAAIAETVLDDAVLVAAPAPSGLPGPKPPYQNPVIGFDCPDPGVLRVDGGAAPEYYAVCTGGSFPIRTSRDLVSWRDTGAVVLPDGKPPWAANGWRNWAPELHRVGDRFVVYFTTVNGADVLSIGAAWADAPEGPYTATAGPLVEHPQGAIDPHYVLDADGRHYLVYKIDGNATGQPTPILVRELAPDGLAFAPGSEAVEILRNDPSTWEGGVVEAAWIVLRDGWYELFYSGNVYDHRYRTGVARSRALTGPYERHGAPVLSNNARWVGPGHGSVVSVGGADYFVYHAWPATSSGTHDTSQGRQVLLDRISWVDGWPQISDGTPSTGLQPWPE